MSTLTALARAQAFAEGRAQPIATVRHLHVHPRPLVIIPLAMAGEANAPLAAMAGTEASAPQLLVVAQPRNRDHRFAFAAELAALLVPYVESFTGVAEPVAVDAPANGPVDGADTEETKSRRRRRRGGARGTRPAARPARAACRCGRAT